MQRYRCLQKLSLFENGDTLFIPTFDGEHPAVLQSRFRARLSTDKLTMYGKWRVTQISNGVFVTKVSSWESYGQA